MAAAITAETDPDVDALLECITWVYRFQERRHCPRCGVPPAMDCGCTLSPTRAIGMSFKQSMYHRRGEYEGSLAIDLLAGGVVYHSMRSAQRMIFGIPDNGAFLSRLVDWAARDRISSLNPSLPKLVMPSNGEMMPETISVEPAQNTQNVSDVDLSATTTDCPSAMGIGDPELDFDMYPLPSETIQVSNPGAASAIVLKQPRSNPVETLWQRCFVSRLHAVGSRLPVAAVAPTAPSVLGVPMPPAVGMSGIGSPPTPSNTPHGSKARPAPNDLLSEPAGATADADVESGGLVESTSKITEKMSRGLNVIKDHGGSSSITPEQLLRFVPMSDCEISKTFRSARRRESAVFGNLRRKIRQQCRRSDLEDMRQRKAECEERQYALLFENRALRAALSAEGTSFPLSE